MPNPSTYTTKVTSINYSWGPGNSATTFNLASAITAESFGTRAATLISNVSGYNTKQVLLAQSICADDVNAPIYGNNNIGQQPVSLQSFLGPFIQGGIGGYPFAGPTGLFAWASHITTGGALFLNVNTHLGVPLSGNAGYVRRRGQGGTLSNTCGAVGVAVGYVALSSNTTAPVSADYINTFGFQQWILTNTVWSARPYLTAANINNITPNNTNAAPTSAQMIVATKTILNAASAVTEQILPIAYSSFFGTVTSTPVFVSYGTFINVDDGYSAYINVDSFKRYNGQGWLDLTSQFRSVTG
jgi:hypothetical protein